MDTSDYISLAPSKCLLDDIIAGQNDAMYKLLPSSVICTQRSTTQAKQQKIFLKTKKLI